MARGEQIEDSDVDVCVEVHTPSMFSLVHIKDELQQMKNKFILDLFKSKMTTYVYVQTNPEIPYKEKHSS